MGKNKLSSKNARNPIYKKATVGAPLKTKSKAKQVKTNLKKVTFPVEDCFSNLRKT